MSFRNIVKILTIALALCAGQTAVAQPAEHLSLGPSARINGARVDGLVNPSGAVTAPIGGGAIRLNGWQGLGDVDMFSQGYESNMFGNLPNAAGIRLPQNVLISADPYGNYANGCALGVAIQGVSGTTQFPVSESDPRSGSGAVVATGQFDTVANCTLIGNVGARLILRVASISGSSITLAEPLTAQQAALVEQLGYLTTNIYNPNLTTSAAAGDLPNKNLFSGFVAQKPRPGDSVIQVYGWAVPGRNDSNTSPDVSNLDTTWSAYPYPVVFLGSGAGQAMFAHNWFFNVDASELKPSDHTHSLIRQLTPLEIDLNVTNGTPPDHSIWWQGIAMNAGNHPNIFTENSQQFYMGGVIPHHLIVDGGAGNWDIEANGLYVPVAHDGISVSGSSGVTSQLSSVWEQWIEGSNRMQVRLYDTTSNTTAPIGWEQAVVHFGPTVDGTPKPTGDMGGNPQGEIQFNESSNYGGVSLCGYAQNCGLTLLGSGHTLIRPGSDQSTQLLFSLAGGGVKPYLQADSDISFSFRNSAGSGVVVNAFGFSGDTLSSSQYLSLGVGASLIGRRSDGGIGATLMPDVGGNWTFGTQVAGGANVKGINTLSAVSLTLATAAIDSGNKATGQGLLGLWNTITPGGAMSELVNVDPGSTGGLDVYDITTGSQVTASARIARFNGSGLEVFHNLYVDQDVNLHGTISMHAPNHPNALYFSLSADGATLQAGTQVSGGANINGLNNVSAQSFTGALHTPASSSEACAVGKSWDDDSYHYVCTATNHIKRVALSDF